MASQYDSIKTAEELLKEVKDFRRKYADTRIVLYHSPDTKRRKA